MRYERIPKKAHMFRNLNTGILYFRKFKKGVGEIQKSCETKHIREAEDKILEYLRDYFGERQPEDKNVRRIVEDEWKEFMSLQKGKSAATYASMGFQSKHLLPFFGDLFVHEINEVIWEKYLERQRAINPARKIFNDWKYFTMFLWFLQRQGKVPRVPKFRNPDGKTKKGRVYSDEELKALLANAGEELDLQILMAMTQGMRIGEILSLEWWQVNFKTGEIYLPAEKTKIRKERTFKISVDVLPKLRARSEASTGGAVFASPKSPDATVRRDGNKSAWTTCRRKAKVRGRFHDFRHTFLTRAFGAPGSNPAHICHYAGLSLEEAQRTYLHFTADDSKAVANLVRVPE